MTVPVHYFEIQVLAVLVLHAVHVHVKLGAVRQCPSPSRRQSASIIRHIRRPKHVSCHAVRGVVVEMVYAPSLCECISHSELRPRQDPLSSLAFSFS